MNFKSFMILIFGFCMAFHQQVLPSDFENILLRDIFEKMDSYKNREMTLKLRFKNIDNIFDKIAFYDRKNYDIIFDISKLKSNKKFKEQALNLHEGMEYLVTFTVRDKGNDGDVVADLTGFTAFALMQLPEGRKKDL